MAIVEPCGSGHEQEGKPTRRGGYFEDACYNGRVVGTIKHRCRGQSSLQRVHSYTSHGYIAGLHRAPLSTGALHGGGNAWRIAEFSYTLSQHEYSARYGASSGRWVACDLALVGLIINLILSDADQSDIGFRGDLSVALAMMNVIF